MIRIVSTVLFVLMAIQLVVGQSVSEWRGPSRTGVYPDTGLLKSWPETGLELLWVIDSLPNGYSSVAVANQRIYLTGIIDDSLDVLVAVGLDGSMQWQTPFGRAWDNSYNPSRCTPTIEGDRAYVSSGLGDVACLNAIDGDIIWELNASEMYKGEYPRFGLSESLLVVDDIVVFLPGGESTTMVALNKYTGEEVWQSASLKDKPSYMSPKLIEWADTLMIVSATEHIAFGIYPESGAFAWTFDIGMFAGGESKRNNQTNTPVFDSGKLFITSGYDHKSVQIELSEEGDAAYFNWADASLDVHHGGVVLLDGYLYGSSWIGNRNGNWVCLDWNTGETMYEVEWENKGSIISAEGMLYCYDEKGGNLALVEATPEGFVPISSFRVPYGKGPHWSHPVIHKQVLYVRHGQALMAFDIASDSFE